MIVLEYALFRILGCPGAIASAMAPVGLIKGRKIEDARSFNDGDVFRGLKSTP